jgi:hypothetical protein
MLSLNGEPIRISKHLVAQLDNTRLRVKCGTCSRTLAYVAEWQDEENLARILLFPPTCNLGPNTKWKYSANWVKGATYGRDNMVRHGSNLLSKLSLSPEEYIEPKPHLWDGTWRLYRHLGSNGPMGNIASAFMEQGQRIICINPHCGEQRVSTKLLDLRRPASLPEEAIRQVYYIGERDIDKFRPSAGSSPEQAEMQSRRYHMMQSHLAWLYVRVDSPILRVGVY